MRVRSRESAGCVPRVDQQESAPGGFPPTNMPIAKTRYLKFWEPERRTQECAPGEKGGAAIVFANVRCAILKKTLHVY